MKQNETICSVSTPQGIGAIAIIRVSGSEAVCIVDQLFKSSKKIAEAPANKAVYGELLDGNQLIDRVLITKFSAPHSYTGEDLVEISCHGSIYIQKRIIELLLEKGARMANPGEFTMRAFMNGKMDLPQAEAIADLIDSQSETTHKLAVNQLKGNFSSKINELRTQFLHFAALLELELDFSEEDVQFVNRDELKILLSAIKDEVNQMINSFKLGNVLKTGIPVAIIGKTNVGKSTLLNAFVQEERAIVSHIPGTTRDTIEDVYNIKGIMFRFIDTAGIRTTNDEIENFGIERTYKAIQKADIILFMIDITQTSIEDLENELQFLDSKIDLSTKKLIVIANKIDCLDVIPHSFKAWNELNVIYISAKRMVNIESIADALFDYVEEKGVLDSTLLTNVRHYDVLLNISRSIEQIEQGIAIQLPTDLLAIEVKNALNGLGLITGTVATDEILETIFSKFCIGK